MNKNPKKVLGIFAHPDDEAFGPGGTLAKWAKEGAEIHLLCATKGESGQYKGKGNIAEIRQNELEEGSKILGVKSVTFLGFRDGEIGNNDLEKLEKLVIGTIKKFKPDTLITFDLNGVSGHLDHIAMSSVTTQSFKKTKIPEQLYYYVLTDEFVKKADADKEYFIYRPSGKKDEEIDVVIDVSSVWETKLKAMHMHKSQMHDVEWILKLRKDMPKHEHFQVRKRA